MASLRSVMVLGFHKCTQIKIYTRCVKFARKNVRLKKYTELNGVHLEHMALE